MLLVLASLPFTSSHAEWIGLVVGVISLIGIGGVVSMLFCHHKGCFRRGRFPYGHYRLCHVHHPHVPSDGKITDAHVHKMGEHLDAIAKGLSVTEAGAGTAGAGAERAD